MMSVFRPKGFFNIKCFDNYKKKKILWYLDFPNIVVDEGLIGILADYFTGSWYIGLKGSNETPLSTWDAAGIGTDFTELTAYNEGNRVLWDKGTITTKNPSNSLNPAEFNIVAPGGTFYGAFVINENTKGGTSGVMWCCADATVSQAVSDGNIIQIIYTITSSDDGV